MQILFT
jgi:hypothetical protein